MTRGCAEEQKGASSHMGGLGSKGRAFLLFSFYSVWDLITQDGVTHIQCKSSDLILASLEMHLPAHSEVCLQGDSKSAKLTMKSKSHRRGPALFRLCVREACASLCFMLTTSATWLGLNSTKFSMQLLYFPPLNTAFFRSKLPSSHTKAVELSSTSQKGMPKNCWTCVKASPVIINTSYREDNFR